MKPNLTDESIDGLFGNKVRVIQARRGYRVSEDAIILTWFVRPAPGALILDAGTGCGVIAFGLAVRDPSVVVIGLEIQEGMADRARRGVILNGLEDRVTIVRGDLRQADCFFRQASFDCVVCNPPYHEPGSGRISMEHEKALSRHQLMMPLEDLFSISMKILKHSGRLSLIYPASRMDKIQMTMQESGFKPSRVLWIHAWEGAEAGLVCLEARAGAGPIHAAQDSLFVYRAPGLRTRAVETILAGDDIPGCTKGLG